MLTINILLSSVTTTDEEGYSFERYPLFLGKRPSEYIDIFGVPLLYVGTSLKWLLWEPRQIRLLRPPEHIQQAVVRYLRLPIRTKRRMDCHQFVDMTRPHGGTCLGDVWEKSSKEAAAHAPPGSYIMMSPEPGRSSHMAVSLSRGLYLAVQGSGGDLCVMDMDQILNCYPHCAVHMPMQ